MPVLSAKLRACFKKKITQALVVAAVARQLLRAQKRLALERSLTLLDDEGGKGGLVA
jgi:hypothetical protein